MKITSLIKELEVVLKEYGDLDVLIQYRDSGGLYHGAEDIEPNLMDAVCDNYKQSITRIADDGSCYFEYETDDEYILIL